jgi:hypothetical protein
LGRIGLKIGVWVLFSVLIVSLSLAALAYAQTGNVYFNDEFNYGSIDQMKGAGWTMDNPVSVSLGQSSVVFDTTHGDSGLHYAISSSKNILDWKAETKSMWMGKGHSVLTVAVATEQHTYGWTADGYYKYYSLYRDSKKLLTFNGYTEAANQYIVLTMVREGNTFSLYSNGNLINTYTEQDGPSKVTRLDVVGPWQADAKYDYIMIGEPTATNPISSPTEATSSFPMIPVIIGGTIAAIVVGGILVYYFVIAGSSAGASAGSATVGAGAAGVASGGGAGVQLPTYLQEWTDNIMHSMNILQDWQQSLSQVTSLSDYGSLMNTMVETILHMPSLVPTTVAGAATGALVATGVTPDIGPVIEQLINQAQQLTSQDSTQSSLNQDSYQGYLEQVTNLCETITNAQTSTNVDIVQNTK